MKIAILENNDQQYDCLLKFIRSIQEDWKVIRYRSSFALVTGIADEMKGDIDLILIHVSPDHLEHIRMAKDLQDYFAHIKVIFYSESNDYAEEIFEAIPTFFLRLPIKISSLEEAFRRVESDCLMEENQTITIKFRGEIQKLRYPSISYVESVGRKLRFYTSSGCFEVYKTMDELMEELPPQFQQCHRSYVVNTEKIRKVTSDGILLSDMELVPMSRTYCEKIKLVCKTN